jgi:hypothetical protein
MENMITFKDDEVTIDVDVLRAHLNAQSENLEGEDIGYEASNATRALEEVRRLFYGTPMEVLFTKVMGVCDVVAALAEERTTRGSEVEEVVEDG